RRGCYRWLTHRNRRWGGGEDRRCYRRTDPAVGLCAAVGLLADQLPDCSAGSVRELFSGSAIELFSRSGPADCSAGPAHELLNESGDVDLTQGLGDCPDGPLTGDQMTDRARAQGHRAAFVD